jgi:hypothetical protein
MNNINVFCDELALGKQENTVISGDPSCLTGIHF